MHSPYDQRGRERFFQSLNERKIELSGFSKLTVENHAAWALDIKNYLTANRLDDFLTPKTEHISSYALRQERLLGELVMSTVSDGFAEVYLKEFKYRLFCDLWFELERCCRSPVNALKPTLNELKSIKMKNCDGLKDYCDKYSRLFDQIPIDMLDKNLHNIFSIFYDANVHFCCKRLVEKNTRLILPKEKLNRTRSDGRTAHQAANWRGRPMNQNFACGPPFGQTMRAFSNSVPNPVLRSFQPNNQRYPQGNRYAYSQQSSWRPGGRTDSGWRNTGAHSSTYRPSSTNRPSSSDQESSLESIAKQAGGGQIANEKTDCSNV